MKSKMWLNWILFCKRYHDSFWKTVKSENKFAPSSEQLENLEIILISIITDVAEAICSFILRHCVGNLLIYSRPLNMRFMMLL